MKRYSRLTIFTILALSLAYAACRKDNSSLDINKIPGVTFDTTGQSTLSVLQFNNLVVKPKLNMEGVNESDLTYSWRITMLTNDTATAEIGRERDLDAVIGFQPTQPSQELRIIYTITDTKRELKYIMIWPLTVRSNFGMGLVIAETDGNGNSDLSHIMSPEVTLNYADVSVKHNIYTSLNGQGLQGEISRLKYLKMSGGASVIALTNNSITRVSAITYKMMAQNNGLFFNPLTGDKVQGIYGNYQNDIVILNDRMHVAWMELSPKWPIPLDYDVKMPGIMASNPFSINLGDPGVKYTPPVRVNFYEEEKGKFYYMRFLTTNQDRNAYPYTELAGQAFSGQNLPGKTNIAAGWTMDRGFLHVLKDKTSGAVGLYLLSGGSQDEYGNNFTHPLPLNHFDITSAPGIQNATLFTILDDQRVFYYASGNKIYAVMYGGSTPVVEERYSAPAGETITAMDIYRHPGYPLLDSYIATNNKLLLVGTHGTEGKVHFIPMKNPGLGTLDAANAKTFGGFGKVTAFGPQL